MVNTVRAGNQVTTRSQVQLTNGGTRVIEDIWFANDRIQTRAVLPDTLPLSVLGLPTLRGYGKIADLHLRAANDASLRYMLRQLKNSQLSADVSGLVENIMQKWLGVDQIDPTSRGYAQATDLRRINARHLTGLERLFDQDFTWAKGGVGSTVDPHNPNGQRAAVILWDMYQTLKQNVTARLLWQGPLSILVPAMYYNLSTDKMVWSGTLADLVNQVDQNITRMIPADQVQNVRNNVVLAMSALASSFGLDEQKYILQLRPLLQQKNWGDAILYLNQVTGDGDQMILSLRGLDDILAGDSADPVHAALADKIGGILNGSAIDETLYGTKVRDILNGGGGDDQLWGWAGNDVLAGNAGADQLFGGAGNDDYLFGRGDGQDVIEDSAGTDRLILRDVTIDQVNNGQVIIGRRGTDMFVWMNQTQDQVTVFNWYNGTSNRVEKLVFADGTEWTTTQLSKLAITGTNEGEALQGTSGADTLDGRQGDDYLLGDVGNDTYLIRMGDGMDYIYDTGGTDKIVLQGITSSQVTMGHMGQDLVVNVAGGSEPQQVTVQNFYANTNNRIETISLAGGVNLTTAQMLAAPIWGTSGSDNLNGSSGNDVFDGFAGNDNFYGGAGNDTYLMYRGSGQDYVTDTAGTDKLLVNANIDVTNLWLGRVANDLLIRTVDGQDQMRIVGAYASTSQKLEQLVAGQNQSVNLSYADQLLAANGLSVAWRDFSGVRFVSAYSVLNNGAPVPGTWIGIAASW